jgi:hypothetical protein
LFAKIVPQRLEGLDTVVVELRCAHPEELPSDPLEVSLAFGVLLVLVRAMPVVAVTFNCESRGGTFYYQVNPSAIDLELWDYAVSLANYFVMDNLFKPGIKRRYVFVFRYQE